MEKKKFDYRHIVSICITVGFLALTLFYFTNSIGRIIESCRDFGVSVAYYFSSLFGFENNIEVTVTSLPKYPFFDFLEGINTPSISFPSSWDAFKVSWSEYWSIFFTMSNFTGYWLFLGNFLYNFFYFLLFAIPIVVVVWLIVRFAGHKRNNDYCRDSRPLRCGKWIMNKVVLPVKYWCVRFVEFLKGHKYYLYMWLAIWALNFNVATIFLEFLAYYFYFVVSFDVVNLYIQVYKLFLDLWTVIDFVPFWVWIIVVTWFLNRRANNRGYNVLRHRERMNRGFVNERGIVTIVYGAMGVGKTALITDMALSAEVQMRDQALEVILDCDMKFPSFPWTALENDLKHAFEVHEVYDVWSCRRFIRRKYQHFSSNPCPMNIYGYDFCRTKDPQDIDHRFVYFDGLKTVTVWDVIEDYSCAYLIYTRQCSLLISNYSIRSDNLMSDLGNFPMWDSDFFRKDPRLMDSFSRHSHILDYDMLRLGKVMNDYNPNKYSFGYGVYVITEIDKERKNSPELSEIKRNSDFCNQKNDMFNAMLKMSRHAVVIDNKVFVKIIADLQRPTSLGADVRELGEVVYIKDVSDQNVLLPWYSPFRVLDVVFGWLCRRFDNYYLKYRFNRGDSTLFCACFKWIVSTYRHYRDRKINTFSSETLSLEIEDGSLDGNTFERKYYRQAKKTWSDRYCTDCLSGIFESRGNLSAVGIDDLSEYASNMASEDELLSQNSHFQNEISQLFPDDSSSV